MHTMWWSIKISKTVNLFQNARKTTATKTIKRHKRTLGNRLYKAFRAITLYKQKKKKPQKTQ